MQSTRGKTWRHGLFDGSSGRTEREGDVVSSEPPPAQQRQGGGQRVWAFLCPNPTCDTELVVFPEHAGATVQCPTCGFAFLAPRVVPLQFASEPQGNGGSAAPRPFAPGARMARPSPAPPAPPTGRRRAAPGPAGAAASQAAASQAAASQAAASQAAAAAQAASEPRPKVAPAEVAAQIATPSADGAEALEALARSVGAGGAPSRSPSGSPSSAGSAVGAASAGSKAADAGPRETASSQALRALALAAADPGADPGRKRSGRTPKGGGLGAQLASAAFEGERRRSGRIHVAGDPSAAREAMDQAARPAPTALPLSEGERAAARHQRTDLVVTWAVAAVVSAGLALAAFISGVPDIGLGSLLFLGLAGARTWWLTRSKGRGGAPRP